MKLKINKNIVHDKKSATRSYQDFRLLNSWVLLINYAGFLFGVILIAIGLSKKIGFWIIITPMIINLVLFILFGIGRIAKRELSLRNLTYIAFAYSIMIFAIAVGMYNIQIPHIPNG